MEAEQAIKILERQRDRIAANSHPKNEMWFVSTQSFIKDFFGENSVEFKHILTFEFPRHDDTSLGSKEWFTEMDVRSKKVVSFLDNCIETIRDKGLYEPPKLNFLYRIGDTWLSVISLTLLPSLFLAGIWVGEYRSDVKNIELRQEIKELKDKSIIPTNININEIEDDNRVKLTSEKDSTEQPNITPDKK